MEVRRDAAGQRHHVGPEREIRHKMGVHHVKVQSVRAGSLRAHHLLGQMAEVGGKQ